MHRPFEVSSLSIQLLADIERLLGRYEGLHRPRPTPLLRRLLRVRTVQGSVAIEGNTLAENQITALIEGKRVVGPPREIREVENALAAYQRLSDWRPERRRDLLKAHAILMAGLIDSAGQWRRGAVGIVQGSDVIHVAPPADRVPFLVQDVLVFLKGDKQTHPIIKAAVMHYELEFIHPFEDGNGRIGRLWHTLVLSRYHSVFEYVPIESVIRERQVEYYKVLGQCDRAGNSTLFIEFSLAATRDALAATLDQLAPAPVTAADRLMTARQHFGGQSFSRKDYLALLQGLSTATASRDLKLAVDEGRLHRTGDKSRTRYQFPVG